MESLLGSLDDTDTSFNSLDPINSHRAAFLNHLEILQQFGVFKAEGGAVIAGHKLP